MYNKHILVRNLRNNICKIARGGVKMILMDMKVDNLYALNDFHMNMSYPKKIVNSSIPNEFLGDRKNFRYKKLNIIMGSNATGKTSIGKLLMNFANYISDTIYRRFFALVDDVTKPAYLSLDFVLKEPILYRFEMNINPKNGDEYTKEDIDIKLVMTKINTNDNYETCAERIDKGSFTEVSVDDIDLGGWFFTYPFDELGKINTYSIRDNDSRYLDVLKKVMMTLDPSIKDIKKIEDVENAYIIYLSNKKVLLENGKIQSENYLSSGTKEGIELAYIIASMNFGYHDFHYCDEMFSYINSDIEKAIISVIIDKLSDRKQVFFTTHNSDVLDMNIPKHSFTFLKRRIIDGVPKTEAVYASDYLKRNTDSLKNAVENDLFCTAPDLNKIFDIDEEI